MLDYRRLGKQRVEGLQILQCILNGGERRTSWCNHPAVLMWKKNPAGLAAYIVAICQEWKNRGYRDTVEEKIRALIEPDETDIPEWMGREDFHASHRSNLLRKDAEWYGRYGWIEDDSQEYVWPVRKSNG
jgi:hypothetical protein